MTPEEFEVLIEDEITPLAMEVCRARGEVTATMSLLRIVFLKGYAAGVKAACP